MTTISDKRRRIDEIDREMLRLVALRLGLGDEIGELKPGAWFALTDSRRESEVKANATRTATECGFDPELAQWIVSVLMAASRRRQILGRQRRDLGRSLPSEGPAPLRDRPGSDSGTVVRAGPLTFGGGDFEVIGGPCSVESMIQMEQCAASVAACGAHGLRGGVYKPRTSPRSFQGLRDEGVPMLCNAAAKYGLAVVTEVMTPDQAERLARLVNVLQIGARNMQNFDLLRAVGKLRTPVLLKRNHGATLEEFLGAAEYILSEGNPAVVLCERGIRTFSESGRYTLDLGAVSALRLRTHLPVIVDPSHAAGDRRFVPALARAAKAAGADGLIVEIHPEPDKARSDGPQSLTLDGFTRLMLELATIPRPDVAEELGLSRKPPAPTPAAGASPKTADIGSDPVTVSQ